MPIDWIISASLRISSDIRLALWPVMLAFCIGSRVNNLVEERNQHQHRTAAKGQEAQPGMEQGNARQEHRRPGQRSKAAVSTGEAISRCTDFQIAEAGLRDRVLCHRRTADHRIEHPLVQRRLKPRAHPRHDPAAGIVQIAPSCP